MSHLQLQHLRAIGAKVVGRPSAEVPTHRAAP
jgi:hypothetical protein